MLARQTRSRHRPASHTLARLVPASDALLHLRALLPLLCVAAVLSSCSPRLGTVSVDCRSLSAPGDAGADTLTVWVHVEDPTRQPRLLLRVDPLSERGAVMFEEGTPGTAAAAAIALTTSGTFEGCLSAAPQGFELRASAAPRGRVWLRVSSNVPVAAWLTIGDDPSGTTGSEAHIVVSPGASGETVARVGT